MKLNAKESFFGPALIIVGFVSLSVFQNCSKEVDFNARPSVEQTNTPTTGNPQGPDGLQVGGNSDVVIRFNETPRDTTRNDDDSVIDYEVTSPGATIDDVRCTLNGVIVPCRPVDRIPVTETVIGQNRFTIIATNSNSRQVEQTIVWEVYENIVSASRNITVSNVDQRVDIIINVDNSKSMEYEQQSMAGRISTLMSRFSHLDYRIAVITTSPIGNEVLWKPSLNYVDGKFIELTNDVFCISKTSHSIAQAQTLLQQNVVRDTVLRDDQGHPIINPYTGKTYGEGNSLERGIYTTYRSFERSAVTGSPEQACLRNGVAKHVILISDEDETIAADNGTPLMDQQKSNPTTLRGFVASRFGNETVFKFHSIIVNPYTAEGSACMTPPNHGARAGVTYAQLSRATGGVIGSVCASDYGAQLGEIGTQVSNTSRTYTLSCVAVENNGQMGQVINLSTGQPVGIAYQFVGDKVEFASPLPSGNYRVNHFCFD